MGLKEQEIARMVQQAKENTPKKVEESTRKVSIKLSEELINPDHLQAIKVLQMEIDRLKNQGPVNTQSETNALFRKMMKALNQAKAVIEH